MRVLRTFLLTVIVVAAVCLILITPVHADAAGSQPDGDASDTHAL